MDSLPLVPRIAERLVDLTGHSMLLMTIPAFSMKYRSVIAALQQSICDRPSALIANVSQEKLLGQRSVRMAPKFSRNHADSAGEKSERRNLHDAAFNLGRHDEKRDEDLSWDRSLLSSSAGVFE